MKLPPELFNTASIPVGTVYYFVEDSFSTSTDPHYFVVLNYDPNDDEILLLVCASSRIEKVQACNRNVPRETLVEISPQEYSCFTKNSIINCNSVLEKPKSIIEEKLASDEASVKDPIPPEVLQKLRRAVLLSPRVKRGIKKKLS